MKDEPDVRDFTITGRYYGPPYKVRVGDTLQVLFHDGRTGKTDVVLQEKLTESGMTGDIFVARATIDGMPAKMGGFTLKKD